MSAADNRAGDEAPPRIGLHAAWAARGFAAAVVPIIPPGAPLAPGSVIAPDKLGKLPGRRGGDGLWRGFDWRREAAPAAALCDAWGAGVGLKGGLFPALDVDVTNAPLAAAIAGLWRRLVGPCPCRIGRAPKALFPFRPDPADLLATGPLTKRRLAFTLAGEAMAVEMLGDGQQWVAAGVHPGTGRPYEWPDGEPEAGSLPVVSRAAVDAFFAALPDLLDMFGAVVGAESGASAVDRASVGQSSLLAPPGADIAAAVAAAPNAGDREGWIRMGAAIKAAGGEVQDWSAWSRKAMEEDDADLLNRWEGFRPPYGVGWPYIERMARDGGWTGSAELDFAGLAKPVRGRAFGRLRLLSAADMLSAPPRDYLLKGVLSRGELSLWWGPPKCGKSFLALRLAYGLALGRGMFGRKAKPCRPLYVAAEGEAGMGRRVAALREDIGDAGEAFACIAQPVQVGPPSLHLPDLIAAALAHRADMVVLDTVARTFGTGDENATPDMNAFVAACDRIRMETGAHVALVHHGRSDGAKARGSVALPAAADIIVSVERLGAGNVAVIEQAKDEASGARLPFSLRIVGRELDADGDEIVTCIAEERAEGDQAAARVKLPQAAAKALNELGALLASAGNDAPEGPGLPPRGVKRAPLATWREACRRRGLSGGGSRGAEGTAFRRALAALEDAGLAGSYDGVVWMTLEGGA